MHDRALSSDTGANRLHLTAEQLEQIAAGVSGTADRGWIEHLDDCEACRRELIRVSADPAFWQQSSAMLRSLDFDELASSADRSDTRPQDDSGEAITLVVRSLLGPTERDGSLGRLGRFEVLGIVGSGGMGVVLKCRDVDIDRVVAVKIPSAHLWRSPAALETLEREARSAASIVHPHVIAIYQVDRWREVPYLVMPYFPGPSLDRRVERSGPLQLAESIRIARQMAEALAAAHARGVIHRDVKPGNILLGRGVARAVLSDFGLAKVQSDATFTSSGLVAGTPSYLSPEQATGARVGPASDLFSLGSVLWTMLTGQVPWAGLHPHAIVSRIAAGNLPPLQETRHDLPPWVARLLEWMHQTDVERRSTSAAELAEVLAACERHMADPDSHPLPDRLRAADTANTRLRRRVYCAALLCAAWLVPLIGVSLVWFADPGLIDSDGRRPNLAIDGSSPAGNDGGAVQPSLPIDPPDRTDRADQPQAVEVAAESIDPMLDAIEAAIDEVQSELQSLKDASQ